MKLLNCSITRIIVALMFVFSIAGNVLAFYHKEDNWLVCDYCGAKHINSFPRDGHYTWCKYAPAQSSSSGGSSTVYVPKSNSSDLDSAILGTALISLFSSTPVKTKTPQEIANEQKKQAEIKEKKDLDLLEKQEISRDEQFWQSGDYIVKEGNLKDGGNKAFGIYNTKTQKWVLNADKQKDNTGRIAIFRKVKKKKDGLWKREDGWWNFGRIRLLNCNDKNSTYNKPLVWMYDVRDYRPEIKKWYLIQDERKYFPEMYFIINDNDELEEIKPLNKNFFDKEFLLNQNGKYGVALIDANHLVIPNKTVIYKYFGYRIIIPTEYDSVEAFNNFEDDFKYLTRATIVYRAKKKDDVYMFGFYGERLSPKFLEYDSITCLPNIMEDFYIVSKDNKFGAVNSVGTVFIPFIYNSATGPYYALRDIFPDVSFSYWYKNKVKPYLTQKGKYEKEEDYQARIKDNAKQEQYILEKTKDAVKEYIEEFKDKIILVLGNKYDTEREYFTIYEQIKIIKNNKEVIETIDNINLPVPIKEAEAFEKNFNKIKQEALKNATYGIQYDKIAIAKITFKMPNGKTYTFDSTK